MELSEGSSTDQRLQIVNRTFDDDGSEIDTVLGLFSAICGQPAPGLEWHLYPTPSYPQPAKSGKLNFFITTKPSCKPRGKYKHGYNEQEEELIFRVLAWRACPRFGLLGAGQ